MPGFVHILIGALIFITILIVAGCLFFYRKPDLPLGLQIPDNHVIGPAFGTVLKIAQEIPGFTTIIIFLSPFDIHYQYCPALENLLKSTILGHKMVDFMQIITRFFVTIFWSTEGPDNSLKTRASLVITVLRLILPF